MLQSSFVRYSVVAASLALAAALASAQAPPSAAAKIGVINLQKAVLDTAEIKKASAAMETKYKPRQAEVEGLRKEIEDLQTRIQTGAGKLTDEAMADLNAQSQKKQRDLRYETEELQSEVDAERNDILSHSSQRMQDVVKKMAVEKGLDVVVEAQNTYFFKPALDLTAEATAAYDKAYPPK